MTNYYTVKLSTDAKMIGCFPQVDCLTQFHAHQFKYDRFPDFDPQLSFELEKKAKLTDVLSQASVSANGLLVNEKTKAILEKYTMSEHRFFPASVMDKKGKIHSEYYWLHLVAREAYFDWIDFPKSKFLLEKGIGNFEEIQINSKEDYDLKVREADNMEILADIVADKIVFTPAFNENLSVFVLPKIDIHVFITSELKEALVNNSISGIEFSDAPFK